MAEIVQVYFHAPTVPDQRCFLRCVFLIQALKFKVWFLVLILKLYCSFFFSMYAGSLVTSDDQQCNSPPSLVLLYTSTRQKAI